MQIYQITTAHGSAKRHVEFLASPEDADFRSACEAAFRPFGFEFTFDGYYFHMNHPDRTSKMQKLSIDSDQWGLVWGDASPWGTTEENAESIELFESILKNSNEFRAG